MTEQIIDELRKAAETIPAIAYIVSWIVHQQHIPRMNLEKLLEKTFGIEFMPIPINRDRSVYRGIRSLDDWNEIDLVYEGPCKDEELRDLGQHEVRFRLKNRIIDPEAEDSQLVGDGLVIYNKTTKSLTYKNLTMEEIKYISGRIDLYSEVFTEVDVKRILKRYVTSKWGKNILGSINAWLILNPSRIPSLSKLYKDRLGNIADTLCDLQQFLEGLPVSSEFSVYPFLDISFMKRNVMGHIKNSMLSEIQQTGEEVKRLYDTRYNRGDTIKDKMDKFQELDDQCRAFAELMELDAKDLQREINELRNEVADVVIRGKVPVYPQMVDFPYGTVVRYEGKSKTKGVSNDGAVATVIGYTNRNDKPYVKIRFNRTGDYTQCAPGSMTIIEKSNTTDPANFAPPDPEEMIRKYETSPGWYQVPGHDRKLRKHAAMELIGIASS